MTWGAIQGKNGKSRWPGEVPKKGPTKKRGISKKVEETVDSERLTLTVHPVIILRDKVPLAGRDKWGAWGREKETEETIL